MEIDEPDGDSEASASGTDDHAWAATWVVTGDEPEGLVQDVDRFERVKTAVDFVFDVITQAKNAGARVEVLSEVKLPLEDVTTERGATGTADIVLILRYADHSELWVIDFKFGHTPVADDTLQLPIYLLAAWNKYGLMDDFTKFRSTVVQPRVRSDFVTIDYPPDELREIGKKVKRRAELALRIVKDGPLTALGHLQVTEKGCRFCKAQAKCPAKATYVHDTVYSEMQDYSKDGIQPIAEDNYEGTREDFYKLLPLFMSRVPEIEDWCKYVRAAVETRLLAGKPVDDGKGHAFKLVQGKAGNRYWLNQDAVLPVLMAHHVPRDIVMHPAELRTPADMEKRMKKDWAPAWGSLKALIGQAAGKPSVAPASDPRPTFAGVAFDGESYSADDLI
jgi:hypothetical protein